ncbi:fructose-6-phosphate aldolase [Candidatus Gottesmanbacteria bacterium]|nr:fructose-6-phosphate aldolase [Candidatus Gottesmanbacteria bacterium]
MLIFLDTGNIDEIKKWIDRGVIDGITTNQKLLLKEKTINFGDFKKAVLKICRLKKYPVSVELTGHESVAKMIKEAKNFASWHKNVVVKVPMITDGMGLNVIKKLKDLKIKTNATLMVSFEQMLLAIKAGASYASIFFNRAKEAGYDPIEIIKRSRDFIDSGRYNCQIISGSIRSTRDVGDSFAAGSDIVTIPARIIEQMLAEKRTQETVIEFDAAWEEFKKR